MIIAIDGYEANDSRRVGIGRYAYEILRNIYRLNSHHAFRIYLPNTPLPDMPPETDWWQYRVLSPKRLWTFFRLPLALTADLPRADVVFSPTHYIPRFIAIPRVMSVMDLSYIAYPQLFGARDLHQLVHWTRYAATHARKIFTISTFTRDAIMHEYGRKPGDVIVTYPGLTMQNAKFKMQNSFGKYILSVGTLQPRKNFVRLIEAFAAVKKHHPELDLVIVGKKGWLYEETLKAPKNSGVEKSVRFLNFVKDEDLPTLYRNAVCLALPSLYEGFGLPVLEALSAGVIVVTSNVSSLPEVAGSAGIYVDPLSVESITKGLTQAIGEYGTIKGKERIALGKEIAKQFSWEKAARQTLAVLENL